LHRYSTYTPHASESCHASHSLFAALEFSRGFGGFDPTIVEAAAVTGTETARTPRAAFGIGIGITAHQQTRRYAPWLTAVRKPQSCE